MKRKQENEVRAADSWGRESGERKNEEKKRRKKIGLSESETTPARRRVGEAMRP